MIAKEFLYMIPRDEAISRAADVLATVARESESAFERAALLGLAAALMPKRHGEAAEDAAKELPAPKTAYEAVLAEVSAHARAFRKAVEDSDAWSLDHLMQACAAARFSRKTIVWLAPLIYEVVLAIEKEWGGPYLPAQLCA